jgi:hypothetical protein
LEPGEGLAKSILHLAQGCLIRVALPGPEETFEPILAVTGYQMDMQVGNALTDAVVDSNERSFSP